MLHSSAGSAACRRAASPSAAACPASSARAGSARPARSAGRGPHWGSPGTDASGSPHPPAPLSHKGERGDRLYQAPERRSGIFGSPAPPLPSWERGTGGEGGPSPYLPRIAIDNPRAAADTTGCPPRPSRCPRAPPPPPPPPPPAPPPEETTPAPPPPPPPPPPRAPAPPPRRHPPLDAGHDYTPPGHP